jgi:hypothetical protein
VAGALTILFLALALALALALGSWEPSVNLSGTTVTLFSLPLDSSYIPSRLR